MMLFMEVDLHPPDRKDVVQSILPLIEGEVALDQELANATGVKRGWAVKFRSKELLFGSDGDDQMFAIAVMQFDSDRFLADIREYVTLKPIGNERRLKTDFEVFQITDEGKNRGILTVTNFPTGEGSVVFLSENDPRTIKLKQ